MLQLDWFILISRTQCNLMTVLDIVSVRSQGQKEAIAQLGILP